MNNKFVITGSKKGPFKIDTDWLDADLAERVARFFMLEFKAVGINEYPQVFGSLVDLERVKLFAFVYMGRSEDTIKIKIDAESFVYINR